jgi:TonB family protein
MFETLPASFKGTPPAARVITSAFLFHAVLIGVAITRTASSGVLAPQVARDTIRVDLAIIEERQGNLAPQIPAPAMPAAPSVPSPSIPPPAVEIPTVGSPNPLTPAAPGAAPLPSSRPPQDVLDSLPSFFRSGDVDDLPQLLTGLHPDYPEALRRAGVGGAVEVEYVVGPDGRVQSRSVRVLSADHHQFVPSVVQALVSARFTAARRGGQSVAVLVRQTIRFRTGTP